MFPSLTKEYFKYTITFQQLRVIIRCISYCSKCRKKHPLKTAGWIHG